MVVAIRKTDTSPNESHSAPVIDGNEGNYEFWHSDWGGGPRMSNTYNFFDFEAAGIPL